MSLKSKLKALGACEDAVEWVGNRPLSTAWSECERGDWMLWLCARMIGEEAWPTHQEIVRASCDCAELVLPIFEKENPKDKRVRECIEVTRKWANGEASVEDVCKARDAADAAAYAADAAYA